MKRSMVQFGKKFIDRTHWYTRGAKETIEVRLYPNNINRETGIESPEAWIPIRSKSTTADRQQSKADLRGNKSNIRNNSEDQNAPTAAH